MTPLKHYLVQRGPEGLERIDVFTDGDDAVEAYTTREHELDAYPENENECCLFGADSLLTLCRTHASWLAPETTDTLALLDE